MNGPAATNSERTIAVIGGGIAGLAAAHRLHELSPSSSIALFEASDRLGGVLRTECQDGFLLELGADNFITNVPWGVELCRRIGLERELIETNPNNRRALIVRGGALYPVPEGFMLMEPRELWPVLASPLLSMRGKARLLGEFFIRSRRMDGDESLASFARRRLGREAFERLVQPLAAGIYTADPEKLSLAATMPRFLEMERRHGGLIRAARRLRAANSQEPGSGARYSLFVAPRWGMQALADAVAARLPAGTVRLSTPVRGLTPRGAGGWNVSIEPALEPMTFDAVILATPAPVTAHLTEPFDGSLSANLAAIPYASSAVVLLGYENTQMGRPPDGFGFVVPDIERRPILAASFTSVKFPDRAPPGCTLVRVFLGGAARPELVDRTDAELVAIAAEQSAELLNIHGPPILSHVARWRAAMPQYHLGHLDRVAAIDERIKAWPGLELAGNAYEGVGVPHTIRSGELAAERVLNLQLSSPAATA
jgi:oxygen-dependent protoporphyrinogen oxidase